MTRHLKLASLIAMAGLIFTSRTWLNFLHKFEPETGLLIKNAVVLFVIFIMHFIDESVSVPHVKAVGVFLIYVAFMMIFNYQSDWIEESGSENVGDQTMDGAVYHRARETFKFSPEIARLVTFVLVPFVLVFAGSRLVKNGQKVRMD
jgi:Ca2+/Na+ antiporter